MLLIGVIRLTKLGRLEKVSDLRQIWDNESVDFTPWLAEEENLKLLGILSESSLNWKLKRKM